VLAVGDVTGRGSAAAAVMADVRAALRAYALVDADPGTVLGALHRFVESTGDGERLARLAYVLVDGTRNRAWVALAGHLPPLLLAGFGGAAVPIDVPPGPPLGAAPGPWPVTSVDLPDGAVLALASDGLVETREVPGPEGLRRLASVLADLDAPRGDPRVVALRSASTLSAQLHAYGEAGDDRTLLLAASLTGRRVLRRTAELDSTPRAPGAARSLVKEACRAWGVTAELTDAAELCVSELVTNAFVHGGGCVEVGIHHEDGRLLLLVADAAPEGVAELREDAPDAAGGRGLVIVDRLTSAWGIERTVQGTTVWCELRGTRPGT
jgi:anti-sigma regulatory factor (Ser/Thr protein kinase)